VGYRFPNDDRPCSAQSAHDFAIRVGDVTLANARAGQRGFAPHVVEVLDGYRNPVKGPARAVRGDFVACPSRFRQCFLVEDGDVRLEMRIDQIYSLEHGAHELVRGEVPPKDTIRRLLQRYRLGHVYVFHLASKESPGSSADRSNSLTLTPFL
jgi:hypothetical protein